MDTQTSENTSVMTPVIPAPSCARDAQLRQRVAATREEAVESVEGKSACLPSPGWWKCFAALLMNHQALPRVGRNGRSPTAVAASLPPAQLDLAGADDELEDLGAAGRVRVETSVKS